MIQILMAAALFGLALARVPAVRRNGNDPVFLAALFAGISSLLLSPEVYYPVDSLVGGINLSKLVLDSSMTVGLWYLRKAVLTAVSPQAGAGWKRTIPMALTLTAQAVFFFLAGLGPSTTVWQGDGQHPITAALFAFMLTGFITWSCGEIAWACFKFVPQMRKAFRVGFSMVGLGSVLAVIVMAIMGVGLLMIIFPVLSPLRPVVQGTPFHLLEMIAVLLVGVGLTIPALAGRATRKQTILRLEQTVARVYAIRQKALRNVDMSRILKTGEDATPHDRLHRMIVEIWDAELAAGEGRSVLTPEDREYILLVESDFDLERTR